MAPRSKGSRIPLGEPLASELADLREAYFGASEIRIIREALRAFIDDRLSAEPEVRKRFEAARKKRTGESSNLRLLSKDGEQEPNGA